ncbi:MAG: hypothetical protein AB1899_11275 [Pseudomonadota bacterium]
MNPPPKLAELEGRINGLTPRERLILFALLLAAVWAILDGLLLAPQDKARQAERAKLQAAQTRLAEAGQALALRAATPDPDQVLRQRIETARRSLETRLAQAGALKDRLLAPRDTVRVLRDLLAGQPGLGLSRLETLAPEPLGLAATTPTGIAPAPGAALYRHGIRLSVTGDYDTLIRYLARLEELPAGFYWEKAELDASRHPRLELTLTLNTLSLEAAWLRL